MLLYNYSSFVAAESALMHKPGCKGDDHHLSQIRIDHKLLLLPVTGNSLSFGGPRFLFLLHNYAFYIDVNGYYPLLIQYRCHNIDLSLTYKLLDEMH